MISYEFFFCAFGRSLLFPLKWPTDEMWSKGAGAALPHRRTLWDTLGTMVSLMPWLPPPQLAVSLWWALKMTSHRGHVVAVTLPRQISIWTRLLLTPSGALCLVQWHPSLWMSRCTLASSPQIQGRRAALQSWLLPLRRNTPAPSAEEVTSWKGQWPFSVVLVAAAACRALTHRAGMEGCTALPMAAAIMTPRWRTQT